MTQFENLYFITTTQNTRMAHGNKQQQWKFLLNKINMTFMDEVGFT